MVAHILIDVISLEQLEQKRMRAVAERSDRDLPAAQGGQCRALQAAAMEDPQRLVEQRSKRFELARCLADAAALPRAIFTPERGSRSTPGFPRCLALRPA